MFMRVSGHLKFLKFLKFLKKPAHVRARRRVRVWEGMTLVPRFSGGMVDPLTDDRAKKGAANAE